MKRQVDKRQREVKEWKKGNQVMLSMKDLVFKERLVKVDKMICGALYDWEGNIKEYSKVKTTGLYEDLFGSEC